MKRKAVAALLALVLAGSFAVPKVQAADAETKTIYIYQMKTEIQEALEAVAEKYKETHPNVEFILESASDNYDTGLKTKFQGGDAPDIFSIMGYSNAVVWADRLEDLSDQPWVGDMVSASAENVTIDGAVKAWPFSVEAAGYVYNAGLFEQAGVEGVPTTREALADTVAKLAEAGVMAPITECYMDWYQLGNFMINLGFAGQDDPVAFIQGLNDGTASFVGNANWEELADYIRFEYDLDTDPQTTDFNTQTSLVGTQDLAITIGGNCWLGANVSVMPGVTIGNGCVIAAGAVVTKDLPDNALAAGVPAKIIRFIDLDEELTD